MLSRKATNDNFIVFDLTWLGSDKLLTDVAPFREVIQPCIPCYSECSKYNCDATCDANKYVDMTFTLKDLDLKSVAVVRNDSGHLINKTLRHD
jgi:hypothetical protein